jgi:cysteine desulfurase
MKRIYLDYAATTPIDPKVLRAMMPYLKEKFGNPSSLHQWGREARVAVEESRKKLAQFLGASPEEIVFTSCATESINLSHKGLIKSIFRRSKQVRKPPHIITSSIEHKAVLESCQSMERIGVAGVTYLPVNKNGLVKLSEIEKAIRPETCLISIMYVNNEVGTVEPIVEIGKLIKKYNQYSRKNRETKIYFHTDATQAIQYLNCDVGSLGVDLLSLTGHKFYAPKGVGALYIRKGTPISSWQSGGGQESGLRGGTENVAYIVALGKAIELNSKLKTQNSKRIKKLRKRLITGVLKIPGTRLTGHPSRRAPHIASFIIQGVEGEAMLLHLDAVGIAASSGSACTSGNLEPSHVLLAMGISPKEAHGSLRFSLGKETTKEEINDVIKILPGIVEKLRKMAPKNLNF